MTKPLKSMGTFVFARDVEKMRSMGLALGGSLHNAIVIGEDDLRHLAMQRAQAVKDALTTKGQIAPERIFLLEPKSLSAEAKQNVSGSRTDFVIR